MKSVANALMTGVLTLTGMIASNSCSRTAIEAKIGNLARRLKNTAA